MDQTAVATRRMVGIFSAALVTLSFTACGRHLLRQIDEDLRPFEHGGITHELLDAAHCAEGPGFRVQIVNGSMWIAGETMTYESRALSVKMMIYTVLQRWGLPDMDFVVSVGDYPPPETVTAASPLPSASASSPSPPGATRNSTALDAALARRPLPIFAMCRTSRHHAILFPDHTFWNWHEASTPGWESVSHELRDAAARLPWADRERRAFFAGSSTSPARVAVARAATSGKGRELLDVRLSSPGAMAGHAPHRAEASPAFVPLAQHCSYQYLLHLPGRTYAARLKYLLACNSTVVAPWLGRGGSKYAGGWFEFYYAALKAGTHYVDVNTNGMHSVEPEAEEAPGAVVDAVAQLAADDARARAIAAAGAAFVADQLSPECVWDYWSTLLQRYAQLQRFKLVKLHEDAVSFEDSMVPTNDRARYRCRDRDRKLHTAKANADDACSSGSGGGGGCNDDGESESTYE